MKLQNANNLEYIKEAKHKLIRELTRLKVLVPFDDNLKLFHGRANETNKKFHIKSYVDNSGNKLGHYNVNVIPGLHTSTYDIAKRYAEARKNQAYKKAINVSVAPEVKRIVATSPNLMIFNLCKIFNLDDILSSLSAVISLPKETEEKLYSDLLPKKEFDACLHIIKELTLCYTLPQISPTLFNNEEQIKITKNLLKLAKQNYSKYNRYVVTDNDCDNYIKKLSPLTDKEEENIKNIAGAINVYYALAHSGDIAMLLSKLQSGFDFDDICTYNLDFFNDYLQALNIVGVHQKIWHSDIINQNAFDDYFFFDTSKINTEQVAKKIEAEQSFN